MPALSRKSGSNSSQFFLRQSSSPEYVSETKRIYFSIISLQRKVHHMSWVYEHCQNLHVTRIHTCHLFPRRKGNLYEQPASGTALQNGPACVLGRHTCCRQPTFVRLRSTTGSLHPTVRVQVTQPGHPHDGALVKELHLNCLRPVCDSRVTCPSSEISTLFLICLLIYMPLMSRFHGASFLSAAGLSVPCA